MTGRRAGNRISGPNSALTDFLAANNISAAQIRDDYERRRQQQDQEEGSAAQTPQPATAGPSVGDSEDEDAEEEEERTKKRKRSQKDAIDKIKKAKLSKKGKKKARKGGSDDDDSDADYDDDGFAKDMYKKARPAPGQLEHCELCSKRFTVTPYTKEGPEGGLLCTPCGKAQTKDLAREKKAAAKPAGRKRRKLESDRLDGIAAGGAKSLQQLCIEKVAKHHEDIEELGDVPPSVLEKLSEIFSKKRVMKSRSLRLFLRPDLENVIVHDAAYLEPEDYQQMFAIAQNMKKITLGNACQMKDEAINYMLERCKKIRHVQLYAANLVSNDAWIRMFSTLGDQLNVIQLKWLDAAFDDSVVEHMVPYCQNLERVKLKLCRRIGENAVVAIAGLPKLQHLSLQMSQEVSTETLCDTLIAESGPGLCTLSLEKFVDAGDAVLRAVHDHCFKLKKLRFSENDTVTDAAYVDLFTEWRNPPLSFVDFNSTRDVDNNNPDGPEQAVGMASAGFKAMMAHSGSNLKHLDIASCRHIELSAFLDVFNGGQTYPNLEHINVSFCNRVDSSVVIGIFKSCPALKKLVAFGCFAVQDVVVPRDVVVIGIPRAADAIEQFGVGIDVDEAVEAIRRMGDDSA